MRTAPRLGRMAAMAAALGAAAAGCGRSPQTPVPRKFSDEQLKARFAYDLGADHIDVSGYSPDQQARYRVFADRCSRCHTLARPINAPIVTRDRWKRYVTRMDVTRGAKLTPALAEQIVDFLTHDAAVRKVERKRAYLAELKRLTRLYAELEIERALVQLEETGRMGKDRGYVSP